MRVNLWKTSRVPKMKTDGIKQEEERLARLSQEDKLDFALRTYRIYRLCLMQSRKRGFTGNGSDSSTQKPHHATLPEYRRGFIESCIVFRRAIYGSKTPIK